MGGRTVSFSGMQYFSAAERTLRVAVTLKGREGLALTRLAHSYVQRGLVAVGHFPAEQKADGLPILATGEDGVAIIGDLRQVGHVPARRRG